MWSLGRVNCSFPQSNECLLRGGRGGERERGVLVAFSSHLLSYHPPLPIRVPSKRRKEEVKVESENGLPAVFLERFGFLTKILPTTSQPFSLKGRFFKTNRGASSLVLISSSLPLKVPQLGLFTVSWRSGPFALSFLFFFNLVFSEDTIKWWLRKIEICRRRKECFQPRWLWWW